MNDTKVPSSDRRWKSGLQLTKVLVCLITASACLASDPRDKIRIDVTLVRVPFVVLGEKNRPLQDIRREELRVSDDGVPQEVKYLWQDTDLPLSIAFLIDISEREGRKTERKYRDAVREFIGGIIGPDDRGLLATLDTRSRIISDVCSTKEQLLRGLDQIHYEGNAGAPGVALILDKLR